MSNCPDIARSRKIRCLRLLLSSLMTQKQQGQAHPRQGAEDAQCTTRTLLDCSEVMVLVRGQVAHELPMWNFLTLKLRQR